MGGAYNPETHHGWYMRNREKKLKQRKEYYAKNRHKCLEASKKQYREIMSNPQLHDKKLQANRRWKRRVKIAIIRHYGGNVCVAVKTT